MNGSNVFGFEMRLAVVALALCGGLVACDGGRYDETTGRYIPGAGSRPLSARDMTPGPVLATAQPQNPCHRPDDLPRAALGTGGSFGVAADQRFGYAQPVAAPVAPGTAAADEFSRTPPAPTLQSDGTPARPAIARVSPESGSGEGGEELLITGSGFGTVQVMVGNTAARITSQSSNAITVLVPAAGRPGITAVVVTNRDGSYAVAGGAYSYM